MNGPQDCLDEPEMMFEDTAVGGSSVGEGVGGDGGVEGDIGREESNTKSSNPLKRGSNSNNATSRKKRVKNPMVKIMKGILNILQSNSAVANKVMRDKLRSESIKEVMTLVVECRAEEGSEGHFTASQLFVKAGNCCVPHPNQQRRKAQLVEDVCQKMNTCGSDDKEAPSESDDED